MKVVETAVPAVKILEPRQHRDGRGFLSEVFHRERWRELDIDFTPVQENQSRSTRGVLRGLHFQAPPSSQAKVVRVVRGRIFDVAVDIRRGSPTYGGWVGAQLDGERGRQMLVPCGFAHGFCTLSDEADVVYLLDAHYAPAVEGGLRWDDPEIGIEWPLRRGEIRLSDRDRRWPELADFDSPFGSAQEFGNAQEFGSAQEREDAR